MCTNTDKLIKYFFDEVFVSVVKLRLFHVTFSKFSDRKNIAKTLQHLHVQIATYQLITLTNTN